MYIEWLCVYLKISYVHFHPYNLLHLNKYWFYLFSFSIRGKNVYLFVSVIEHFHHVI